MANAKANGAVTTKAETLPAMNMESLEKFAGTGLDSITNSRSIFTFLKV